MKTNFKLLMTGIFFLLLPSIYYYFISIESDVISLIAIASVIVGAMFILYSFIKKENYKLSEIKNGKIFEIKSLYLAQGGSRVGISFKENGEQYFMSPIPEELKKASCKEKYYKKKNKIVKI